MPAPKPRKRSMFSVSSELLTKSREAALAAVQIFNSPLMTFKSEIFVVLMNIAWTYLLHAHYRKQGVEYRYFDQQGNRRIFHRTKSGAHKHWELERCLNESLTPIDKDTSNNLRFLIGLRHEIEHQMTRRLDNSLSAKFQACCLNYNRYAKKLFGESFGIDKHLSISLQFSAIDMEQKNSLPGSGDFPAHIKGYLQSFETALSEAEYNSELYSYRVLFVAKTANRKGQADQVIEFIKADSPMAKGVNHAYTVVKETERPKFLPSGIVKMMKQEGFHFFTMNHHTGLWQSEKAKDPAKGFGVKVENAWYWYENWVEVVREYCKETVAKRKG